MSTKSVNLIHFPCVRPLPVLSPPASHPHPPLASFKHLCRRTPHPPQFSSDSCQCCLLAPARSIYLQLFHHQQINVSEIVHKSLVFASFRTEVIKIGPATSISCPTSKVTILHGTSSMLNGRNCSESLSENSNPVRVEFSYLASCDPFQTAVECRQMDQQVTLLIAEDVFRSNVVRRLSHARVTVDTQDHLLLLVFTQ